MNPGLPPSRNKNEGCVLSKGPWATLGQSLRRKDPLSEAGALSLPPSLTWLFSKWRNFLLSRGDKSTGWAAAALTLSEPLPT